MANKYDILEISERAKNDKETGSVVINGCVGTFRNDYHVLISFPSVSEYLTKTATEYLNYSRILGPKPYLSSVLHWLFNNDYQEITRNKNILEAGTIGGTGAVFDVFKYLGDNSGAVILSDICWPNYFTIARQCKTTSYTYPLFKDNKFNLKGLEDSIIKSLEEHDIVLIVINDPCQNPTRYSMTDEEYINLFYLLNKYNTKAKNVDIIFDIAYIEFSSKKPILYKYLKSNYNFNVYLAFSASKTFGIYGLRCGALIGFMKSKEENEVVTDAIADVARGSISSPNAGAMGALTSLFNDDKAVEDMRNKLIEERNYLKERATRSLQILKANSIDFLPYDSGFFITIKTSKNAYALSDQLEKMHIYLVPISDSLIRIAVCSLSINEVEIIP